MKISTGETTEWLSPEDAEEIKELVRDMGYDLGDDDVFVLAGEQEDYDRFNAIYMKGVESGREEATDPA